MANGQDIFGRYLKRKGLFPRDGGYEPPWWLDPEVHPMGATSYLDDPGRGVATPARGLRGIGQRVRAANGESQVGGLPAPIVRQGDPEPVDKTPEEEEAERKYYSQESAPLAPAPSLGAVGRYKQENPQPRRLAPAPMGRGRAALGALATFAAGIGSPEAGARVGRQIFHGPYERAQEDFRRRSAEYQAGLEGAYRQAGEERAQAGEQRAQAAHERRMLAPAPESPEAKSAREQAEAEQERQGELQFRRELAKELKLTPGTPAYNELISGQDLGPHGEVALFLDDPAAYERLLQAKSRHRVSQRTATEIRLELAKKDPELYRQVFDRAGIRSEQQLRLRIIEAAMRLSESITGEVDRAKLSKTLAELSTLVGVEMQSQGAKTASRQEVEAFARSKGITYEEAERQLKAEGYVIQ